MQPATQFANGRSPWPVVTTSATKKEPVAVKPVEKRKYAKSIDTSALKLELDVPVPASRVIVGKYDKLFSKMPVRGSYQLPPDQVQSVANALRKWLKEHKKDGELMVVSIKQGDAKDPDKGRVWLWPRDEHAPSSASARAARAAKNH